MDALDREKLTRLIEEGDWTPRRLALATGLAHASIWRTLQGRTTPNLDTLAKICAVLRVRVSEVLVEEIEYKRAA
jgi:transcriptional regulator with XRE-family HTH domain